MQLKSPAHKLIKKLRSLKRLTKAEVVGVGVGMQGDVESYL